MRIIAVAALRAYWLARPDSRRALQAWVGAVRAAQWAGPADIKAQFRNASILPGRRVVFNIKGNEHRLVVVIAYAFGAACVKFVGTHAEYDAVNVQTINKEPRS